MWFFNIFLTPTILWPVSTNVGNLLKVKIMYISINKKSPWKWLKGHGRLKLLVTTKFIWVQKFLGPTDSFPVLIIQTIRSFEAARPTCLTLELWYLYRVGNDLTPPPQPQLQTSQENYTYSFKISSILDSCAGYHEPELIFEPRKSLF